MARGADDPTSSHQVVEQLQQVVQQLQAQTEELKQIRRFVSL
jgi:flagellar hook-associated protein FlgK